MFKSIHGTRGFTLIELLVVISIIGLLSSVVLASLNSARQKTRDTVRISNLNQTQKAIELYYDKCGTYIVRQNCTGTAYGSEGSGWLAYPYPDSAGSIAQGLIDNGVASTKFIDPSGQITSNGIDQSGYMIAVTDDRYTIWANLENPDTAKMQTQNTCNLDNYDNYNTSSPPSSRMNYCVSNFAVAGPAVSNPAVKSNQEIWDGLINLVRTHPCFSINPNCSPYDFNGDTLVNSTDVNMVRLIYTASYDAFNSVYTVFQSDIASRYGSLQGDSNFESAYDVDQNGVINQSDWAVISGVLIGDRIYP
ncbi:MAG: type II secretion system protein [bacterium]|nr:type II secretion system protein [bacterium]